MGKALGNAIEGMVQFLQDAEWRKQQLNEIHTKHGIDPKNYRDEDKAIIVAELADRITRGREVNGDSRSLFHERAGQSHPGARS